jgi:hypothetical protein
MKSAPMIALILTSFALAGPAVADPLCAPFHAVCTANPLSGQHVDVTTTQGIEAHAGDYQTSSWGDCASGNCFHGTAVLVAAPGTALDVRVGQDGVYPYTLVGVTAGGIGVVGFYHNDQYDPVFGFGCVGSPSFYWSCGFGYGIIP